MRLVFSAFANCELSSIKWAAISSAQPPVIVSEKSMFVSPKISGDLAEE
jgi:hypothetical protein